MAVVVWPAFLQEFLNTASFSYAFGDTTIRSENDTGLAKVRRRYTKSVDVIQCSIDIEFDDFSNFENFYDVDLNGGVTRFQYPHPFTQVPTMFRMVGPPALRPLGGRNFEVTMQWEKLP